jgi:transcription-repair coupling factor (superfamily II helicase)
MSETKLPVTSFELPSDRRVLRARDIAARAVAIEPGGKIEHFSGFSGCMTAVVARAIALADARPIVCVTGDVDGARQLADDLAFFWKDERGGANDGEVLIFLPNEASPYADVNPDRRAAMARLVTLSRLARGLPWRFLVVPAAGLARKVVPKGEVKARSDLIRSGQQVDRERLARSLADAGYLRVPLVEDPGTFALRGSVVDLWPASSALPIRMDLDGDTVLSLRRFDPDEQRSIGSGAVSGDAKSDERSMSKPIDLKEVWLPPVREAIVTEEVASRARAAVRSLCDAVDLPSSRARALVEDVAQGRAFFGAEGFLPAYYPLETLGSYIPADALVLIEDPPGMTRAIREEIARAQNDLAEKARSAHFPIDQLYADETDVVAAILSRRTVAFHRTATIGTAPTDALTRFETAPQETESVASSDMSDLERAIARGRASRGKDGALGPLADHIAAFRDAGLAVFIAARTASHADRLVSLVRHRGIDCCVGKAPFDPRILGERGTSPDATVVVGPLARGVVAPAEGYALVTEEEIFGRRARRSKPSARLTGSRQFVQDLRALQIGDHVVHVEHGIGKYRGLIHKDVGGMLVDLLVVEYAANDKLYLPVYRLNQVQKWSGGDAEPRLDRLGGQTFAKKKTRAAVEVRQLADELLRLYAERHAAPGDVVSAIDDDYRALEATFPFDETPDQARAIAEVFEDLETPKPMDRLVCGDVGFGKTEVAIRAAFRVAQTGKQVAVLCPTTVLAEQHWLSFQARIGDYPIRVALLSRFRSRQEQADVVAGLKNATIDIVIGTHRLLSKDVHFGRLGLLVIDEEQRFGVAHKERIKKLKTNVDVLTLTATPIPRTLQMAVAGIRDMSVIATPPVDRRAIRTVVTCPDSGVVREAIRRELARGGQTFYVHNEIDGIHGVAQRVQALVPEARIAVGHGQMAERELERTMIDFIDGRYDVLVATTIIENGIDIPRANTIIVDRADTFGLAQLYQLRGRVGRSKERGYCYLVVPPFSEMNAAAQARVEALERYTELGSGFHIAALDLTLRGAGEVLGREQSGAAASVGFDLFCELLKESVHELRGEQVVHEVEPELSFDVETLLPEDYVADVGVRLSLYKRLAGASSDDEVSDLAAEMEDRFGPAPQQARQLLHLMRIKTELRRLRALGCEASARAVTLHLRADTPLDPGKLTALVLRRGGPYRLTPDMRLTRRTASTEHAADGLEATERMLGELAVCWKDA